MSTKIIVLKSSDGRTFKIEDNIALQSQIIANMVNDKCADNEIPIPNVTSKILEMVIKYMEKHHVVDANPSSHEDLKKWDEQFMQSADQSTIVDLIFAAHHLEIQSLLDLTCQTVADMIKDKTPAQIRADFNIENDFTRKEEEDALKKYQWAFE